MSRFAYDRIQVLNVGIDNVSREEAVERIDELCQLPGCDYVVTPNVDDVVNIERDPVLGDIFASASLSVCDGKPLVWVSRLNRNPLKEKVSGRLLLLDVCEMAAKRGHKVFLLGAAEGVADKAAENLKRDYPGLIICGTYSPPFGFENDANELSRINETVNASETDILVLALGGFKQQRYIWDNRDSLECSVALCLGAAVDYAAGVVKPIPDWATRHGLAWVYRLIGDPKRLARRYWGDFLGLIPLVLKYMRNGGGIV